MLPECVRIICGQLLSEVILLVSCVLWAWASASDGRAKTVEKHELPNSLFIAFSMLPVGKGELVWRGVVAAVKPWPGHYSIFKRQASLLQKRNSVELGQRTARN